MRYNASKPLSQYNIEGEDNPQYATVVGTPAWYTLQARGEFAWNQTFKLQAGVDNILDRHYRTFMSGISGAGRNVWVAVRASF